MTRNKGENYQTSELKAVPDLMANTMITSTVGWNLTNICIDKRSHQKSDFSKLPCCTLLLGHCDVAGTPELTGKSK